MNPIKLFVFLIVVSLMSCTDTENDSDYYYEPTLSNKNDVLEFEIVIDGIFNYRDIIVSIDHDSGEINVSAPYDFDLSKVSQYTTISNHATVVPKRGDIVDFREPVLYTVTAQDGSEKVYTVKISRQEQLPVEILVDGAYGTHLGKFCDWDDILHINGANFLKYRTDEDGNRILNNVILKNQESQIETVFSSDVFPRYEGLGSFREALEIKIPENFPLGFYDVTVVVGSIEIQGDSIGIAYPSPKILEYPSQIKVGDKIDIKGKFFTNIPKGTNYQPRVRLYKFTNLQDFYSDEFVINSFTESSINATVKDFIDKDAYIYENEIYIQMYSESKQRWIFDYKEITLVD